VMVFGLGGKNKTAARPAAGAASATLATPAIQPAPGIAPAQSLRPRGQPMTGLMQDWQLTVDRVIGHAHDAHGHREIVTRSVEGPIVRETYADLQKRAKQVSAALIEDGVMMGDRIATLAWNTARHMEAWYGTMGIGSVLHTVNPRLFPEQIAWILNHAG